MSEHFNELTPARAERLAILAEECGETIQVIGKILRHGMYSRNPTIVCGPTNAEMLEKELGDIQCAVSMLVDADDLRPQHIMEHGEEKLQKIQKYLHHQEASERPKP